MPSPNELSELLFPYDKVRPIQDEILTTVQDVLKHRRHLIMHAPTGIGKTAAVLSPALAYALNKKKIIFFLTNRHTQHIIAINTLKKIHHKYSIPIIAADIVGKRWMCLVNGANKLLANEFAEYCKSIRENNQCEFYNNTKKNNDLKVQAKLVVEEINKKSPLPLDVVKDMCTNYSLCPYEILSSVAKNAIVIIADYYYIFNPVIFDSFFKRIDKDLSDVILIIDEAHNLPSRIREIMSDRLSTISLKKAVREATKFGFNEAANYLVEITNIVENLAKNLKPDDERLVTREEFVSKVNNIMEYNELISDLEFISETVRNTKKHSSISSVAKFLVSWQGGDEGFVRIIKKTSGSVILSYRCLDPSMIAKPVIERCCGAIAMSGTLMPTQMYRDLLGFPPTTIEKNYKSPFPKKNRMYLVVPESSTKYLMRNDIEFKKISDICAAITNNIKGCSAIFFPSYALKDSVSKFFQEKSNKKIFNEHKGMNAEEKKSFIELFKSYEKRGAVLLSVASGSFGEGIDLPGILKCVIVVGIPLQKPDLETKALINYYNSKFGKGWDYGYILPAFNKSIQSAGRCIRSSKDKGVIVFVDKRYCWPLYLRCFPPEWDIKITKNFIYEINQFFKNNKFKK